MIPFSYPKAQHQILVKLFLMLIIMLSSQIIAFAQDDFQAYSAENLKITNTGMMVLGGWAVSNILTGAYGWHKNTGDRMYFHQMNLFWNTVNLSIAGFAIYNNLNTDFSILSQGEILQEHLKLEKILLINAGLDIGYIGTGVILKNLTNRYPNRKDLLTGYGNSIILQGGFLLVFDAVMYGILKSHRINALEKMDISSTRDMIGLQITLNL